MISGQVIKVEITFDPRTGGVNVAGPLEQKVLMYGLLEQAKILVSEYDSQKTPGIAIPPAGMVFK